MRDVCFIGHYFRFDRIYTLDESDYDAADGMIQQPGGIAEPKKANQPLEINHGGNQKALNPHFGQTATPSPSQTMPLFSFGKNTFYNRRLGAC